MLLSVNVAIGHKIDHLLNYSMKGISEIARNLKVISRVFLINNLITRVQDQVDLNVCLRNQRLHLFRTMSE